MSSLEDLTWDEFERLIPVLLEMAEAYKRGELTGEEVDALRAIVESVWEVLAPVVVKMWEFLEPLLIERGEWPPKELG